MMLACIMIFNCVCVIFHLYPRVLKLLSQHPPPSDCEPLSLPSGHCHCDTYIWWTLRMTLGSAMKLDPEPWNIGSYDRQYDGTVW